MTPKELLHYTRKDIALEKILFNKQFRFSSLGLTNDPKETQWRATGVMYPSLSSGDDPDFKFMEYTSTEVSIESTRIRNEEWKFISFSQHRPGIENGSKVDRPENPFDYGFSRPRMWAQYAENHSGCCLVFDRQKLDERIYEELEINGIRIYSGSIEYSDIGSMRNDLFDYGTVHNAGVIDAVREYYYKYHHQAFFMKAKDWEAEYEYRWLIHSKDSHERFISIDGALSSVIVGFDFPKAYEPSLIELCEHLKIPAGRMSWGNGIPSLAKNSIYNP